MGAQGDTQGMPPGGGAAGGMPTGAMGMRKYMDGDPEAGAPPEGGMEPPPEGGMEPPVAGSANPLPDPTETDIKRFDLEIKDFSQEMDEEEEDRSEEE